ncbi:AI-2E family transporter [Nocardioides speluncae]|uniref:AI-2E family transporter n=1 Tax=Nocardioides speluncae TaxID=2670337 RepID=UPI001F0BAB69|nr:AI-2E family transporter [Nocardioides speluncae]
MSNDADGAPPPEPHDNETGSSSRRLPLIKSRREHDEDGDGHDERLTERISQQIAHQWALIRAERRHEHEPPRPVRGGPSNFTRAQVPWGLDLAAAWSWRFLVISAAGFAILWVLAYFRVITLPIVIALLITALASPGVRLLQRIGIPKGLSAGLVVIGGIAFVGALLTFAGQQVAQGANDLADQVVVGLEEIRKWLRDGPLDASDSQINGYIEQAQKAITERSKDGEVMSQLTEVGTTIGHVVAGFFIVLFSTYFFLADGERIWSWFVRLAPRAARERLDSSGRVAWISLTQFVRATVIVALVDAIGIMIVAAILGVPFVLAIGVLVFIGAFIPMIGATIAGSVAVLVALVDQGPVTALLMLGGVILVQQIEGHVLQPFLMGRWVSVHPLGVIVAIGGGVIVAGIAGALIAVPLVAALNAVVQHLAAMAGPDPAGATEDGLDPPDPGEPDKDQAELLADIKAAPTSIGDVDA